MKKPKKAPKKKRVDRIKEIENAIKRMDIEKEDAFAFILGVVWADVHPVKK